MRFWTSDLHLGHANIIEYCNRPYKDVDHMNTEIVRVWNETVSPDDEVWIVGDFALGKIADTLPIASRLNGRKTLIVGNHDRPFKQKGRAKWEPKYRAAGFSIIYYGSVNTEIGDVDVIVNHFPYTGESVEGREDRYTDWRPVDTGRWLICGHIHDAWMIRDRQINVGWDIWGRPITDDDLYGLIR